MAALLFLHPCAIAYVPPIEPAAFEGRFGIEYETFLELAYPPKGEEPFIYPVLNHPYYYRETPTREALSELLVRMPPTWERWHEALRASGWDQVVHQGRRGITRRLAD